MATRNGPGHGDSPAPASTQTQPSGATPSAATSDVPGYLITGAPGIFSRSITGGTNLVAVDAKNGTENPVATFTNYQVTLPPGEVGEVVASANNQNLLDTVAAPDAGFGIDVSFAMDLQLAQKQLVRPIPANLALTGMDASGAPATFPLPMTWSFVDTSKSGHPARGSVQGNPSLSMSGSFTVHFQGFVGTGGTKPLSTPPDKNGGTLNGTGIFFVSTATGVSIVGPVTDPVSANNAALRCIYPVSNGNGETTLVTQFHDGFFRSTNATASESYKATTTAAGETITYNGENSVAFVASNVQLDGGESQMSFSFNENVSAS